MTGANIMWNLLLLAALFSLSSGANNDCPDDGDIYPCFCTTDHVDYSYVTCGAMRDLNRIKQVLDVVKGRNVSLGFEKTTFGEIPSDFFQGQIGRDVHFDHCRIHSFGSRPFSGMEKTLKKIYVYGSVDKRRHDLETFPLGHLKSLHSLQFQANDIKRLGNDWFEDGPVSLEDVSLEANDIEELGDKAFASLTNLEQIWLGDNRIKVVKRSMFPQPAAKLTILEISFNGIEQLPEDFFTGMPSLRTVNLAGNKLVTLPEKTWTIIFDQLKELYVQRNYDFECGAELRWIYHKKLPEIFIGQCYGTNSLRGKDLNLLTLEDLH